jgi:hypothetical protein
MAELQSLKTIFQREGLEFIQKLFNNFVIVSEKVGGTRFAFEKSEDGLTFFKKEGKITKVDRSLSQLYEQPIRYIETLSKDIIKELPEGYRYGFRYFLNTKPETIQYDNMPLNGLILTDVQRVSDGKMIEDPKIIQKISDLLTVQSPPIIWYGKLDDKQKDDLLTFIKTPESELTLLFKTSSFTKYVISILNPKLKKTALNNDLSKPIDSIIFKFLSDENRETVSAKVIEPIIAEINRDTKVDREPTDMYGIILSDIVEFLKITGLNQYTLKETEEEDRFLELMCLIFNEYIKKNEYKYQGVEMDPLSFNDVPQFDLNIGFITNQTSREYLEKSKMNKIIFRILVSSIIKPKKKPTGTLTELLLRDLKDISTKISNKVQGKNDPTKNEGLETFEDFLKRKQEGKYIIKD